MVGAASTDREMNSMWATFIPEYERLTPQDDTSAYMDDHPAMQAIVSRRRRASFQQVIDG
jgi:hypothetical protein